MTIYLLKTEDKQKIKFTVDFTECDLLNINTLLVSRKLRLSDKT